MKKHDIYRDMIVIGLSILVSVVLTLFLVSIFNRDIEPSGILLPKIDNPKWLQDYGNSDMSKAAYGIAMLNQLVIQAGKDPNVIRVGDKVVVDKGVIKKLK